MPPADVLCKHDLVERDCADCHPRHPVPTGPRGGWYGSDRYMPGPEHPAEAWDGMAAMAAEHDEESDGLGPWIMSKYNGTCRGCGHRWEPGEWIRFSEDEDSWLCATCGADDQ